MTVLCWITFDSAGDKESKDRIEDFLNEAKIEIWWLFLKWRI